MSNDPVIVTAKRIPTGCYKGCFSNFKGSDLASFVLREITKPFEHIDEVIIGSALQAGQGQGPARQAVIKAGLPNSIPCTMVNKVCGSGMKAIMYGCSQIISNHTNIIIAGAMESMSQAPHLLDKVSSKGTSHYTIYDHIYIDGLLDPYHPDKNRVMGIIAEERAKDYNLKRIDQEEHIKESFFKAKKASQNNWVQNEMLPVAYDGNVYCYDEPINRVKIEKFSKLKPAFKNNGTITAATAAPLADGAAFVVLSSQKEASNKGLNPLARVIGFETVADDPDLFVTAPVKVVKKLLEKINWSLSSVDVFEINEAFAIVPMIFMKELSIPREKINVHGGACILGHPLGATSARIVVSLVHALITHNLKRGVAAVCIGGGEATAIAIEKI
ncbi:MAG: thiolase family protein [Alphaproteobacteria bacterium]